MIRIARIEASAPCHTVLPLLHSSRARRGLGRVNPPTFRVQCTYTSVRRALGHLVANVIWK